MVVADGEVLLVVSRLRNVTEARKTGSVVQHTVKYGLALLCQSPISLAILFSRRIVITISIKVRCSCISAVSTYDMIHTDHQSTDCDLKGVQVLSAWLMYVARSALRYQL